MNLINTKGINTNTVSITDHEMISANVARVVIAFTGQQNAENLVSAVGAQLKNLAAPIEASFRIVKDNVAVGFVRATQEVKPTSEKELRAYRVMSSNIMMDENDKTLWEVKKSGANLYLARHGNEDLSELVSASVNPRSDVPRLRHLSMATAAPREFVAFATDSGDMDYGFVVASNETSGKLKVVSSTVGAAVVISTKAVAGVYDVKVPRAAHERITAAGIDRADVAKSIDYYSRLYSYDQPYLNKVIKNIEESAAM